MTNKELVIKKLSEDTDTLIDILARDCELCEAMGTKEFCTAEYTKHFTCHDTLAEWLKKERNLPFNIGDVVEVRIGAVDTQLRYYVGNELNLLYFTKTKETLEAIKARGLGCVRKQDLLCFYLDSVDKFVTKVGDSNA